jgi:hypothetical protein
MRRQRLNAVEPDWFPARAMLVTWRGYDAQITRSEKFIRVRKANLEGTQLWPVPLHLTSQTIASFAEGQPI